MLYKQAKSKNWYVKLKHRGKVIRRSTGTSVKRDAQRVEAELRRHLSRLRQQSGYTFSDAAIRWLQEKKHKRSLSTDVMILEWFAPHLENTCLSEITRDEVERLRSLRLESSSENTVNRYFALLRAILKCARDDWEWVEKVPKVPMYAVKKREPRFLTWDGFVSLAEELPSHLSAPAWFAVSTGLRSAAIRSLRWDWINRDGVRFPPEVMKNGKWLRIPLSPTAWYVLAEALSLTSAGPQGVIFVNHAGNPWAGKFTTRAWYKAAKRAGLEGVTFHDLRHTFASWKLQDGVPEHVVMALGGWESREAFKIYARFSNQSLAKLAGYV